MYYGVIIALSITTSISRGKNEVNDGNGDTGSYLLTCVRLIAIEIALPSHMFYTDLAAFTETTQTLIMLRKASISCRVLEVPVLQVLSTQKTDH